MDQEYTVSLKKRLCAVCNERCGEIALLVYRPTSDTWDTIGLRCAHQVMEAAHRSLASNLRRFDEEGLVRHP